MIKNQGESTEALSEKRRRLWLAAISRADLTKKILENDCVCGDHFHSGEAAPDWVSSLNLGHDKLNQSATKESDTATKVERAQRVTERRKRQLQRQEEDELKQKINKPDELVKHIFQQSDKRPMSGERCW